MNRGSAYVAIRHGGIRPASMRPRFMNRGSLSGDPLGALDTALLQ